MALLMKEEAKKSLHRVSTKEYDLAIADLLENGWTVNGISMLLGHNAGFRKSVLKNRMIYKDKSDLALWYMKEYGKADPRTLGGVSCYPPELKTAPAFAAKLRAKWAGK